MGVQIPARRGTFEGGIGRVSPPDYPASAVNAALHHHAAMRPIAAVTFAACDVVVEASVFCYGVVIGVYGAARRAEHYRLPTTVTDVHLFRRVPRKKLFAALRQGSASAAAFTAC